MKDQQQLEEFMQKLSEVLITNNLKIAELIESFINKHNNG